MFVKYVYDRINDVWLKMEYFNMKNGLLIDLPMYAYWFLYGWERGILV